MPLIPLRRLLADAAERDYAVGAFNVANLEMISGAIRAAEELHAPVILQIAEARLGPSPLELIGPSMVAAARDAKVPTAVNFDHGTSREKIAQALAIGFNSVMIDGSARPLSENIRMTNEIRALAARHGAAVEAEFGAVGRRGATTFEYTEVEEAARFYEATGGEALAIAIGNAHGVYRCTPKLNFEVLAAVHQRLPVPLVLHGGSGLSRSDFRSCIARGIRKINVATATFASVEASVRRLYAAGGPEDYFDLHRAEIDGAYENVRRHIRIFGSENRAAGILNPES